jgi:hypothetical protein
MKKILNIYFFIFLACITISPRITYGLALEGLLQEIFGEMGEVIPPEEMEEFQEFLREEGIPGIEFPTPKVEEPEKKEPVAPPVEEEIDLKTLFLTPPTTGEKEEEKLKELTTRIKQAFDMYTDSFLRQLQSVILKVASYTVGIDITPLDKYKRTIEKIEPALRKMQNLKEIIKDRTLQNPYLKYFFQPTKKEIRESILKTTGLLSSINAQFDELSEEELPEYDPKTKRFIDPAAGKRKELKQQLISLYSDNLTTLAQQLDEIITSPEVKKGVEELQKQVKEAEKEAARRRVGEIRYGGPRGEVGAARWAPPYRYDRDYRRPAEYPGYAPPYRPPIKRVAEPIKPAKPEKPALYDTRPKVTKAPAKVPDKKKEIIPAYPYRPKPTRLRSPQELKKEIVSLTDELFERMEKEKEEIEKARLDILQDTLLSDIKDDLNELNRSIAREKKRAIKRSKGIPKAEKKTKESFETNIKKLIPQCLQFAKYEPKEPKELDVSAIAREQQAAATIIKHIQKGQVIPDTDTILLDALRTQEESDVKTIQLQLEKLKKEVSTQNLQEFITVSQRFLKPPHSLMFKKFAPKTTEPIKKHVDALTKIQKDIETFLQEQHETKKELKEKVTDASVTLHKEVSEKISDEDFQQLKKLISEITPAMPTYKKKLEETRKVDNRFTWMETMREISDELAIQTNLIISIAKAWEVSM